jgi:uncharacterized protein (DUF2147 family)
MMRTGKWAMLVALLTIGAEAMGAAAGAQSITGDWQTDDRSAIVRVAPCGDHMCGTILRVLNRAAPRQDINNPDPARRNRPLIGVPVLQGFSRSGAGWAGGMAYDPKAGKSYKSKLALADAGTLAVTGCIMFLCRTRHWTRAD